MLLGRIARRRHQDDDEGTIAILAAVIIPGVLLILALALTTLVWGASDTEVQRASDQGALQAAAAEVLVPNLGISTPAFDPPTLATTLAALQAKGLIPAALANALPPAIATLSPCQSLGNVVSATQTLTTLPASLVATLKTLGINLPSSSLLSAGIAAVAQKYPAAGAVLSSAFTSGTTPPCSPLTVKPSVPVVAESSACNAVKQSMSSDEAPYSTNFFAGDSSTGVAPDCAVNHRVNVYQSSQTPLLGFDGNSVSAGGATVTVPGGFSSVQTALNQLGINLGATLPNTICPQVTVEVDQPVHGALFSEVSEPNGRSTAQRVVKNAVVVPVFNGASLTTPIASGSVGTTPINLNSSVLNPLQKSLIGTLNTIDDQVNSILGGPAAPVVGALNGTLGTVSAATGAVHVPVPAASASLGNLDLLKCLTTTLSSLYNPPTSDTATVQSVLSAAAQDADPVELIQVGVQPCKGAQSAAEIYGCVLPAVTGLGDVATQELTGLYDVPILDVTPVVIKQVANDPTNFTAVAVDATQATGAFRSVLVRSSSESTGRYTP